MRRVIVYEPTSPEILLLALRKTGNVSLDILLGKKLVDNDKTRFRKATERLRKRKLIYGERKGKRIIFELTEEGRLVADKVNIKLEMAKRRRWDGIWRIIIFDVPEKLRGKRDLLRKELVSFGFMQLQKSVWAYPHALPKEFVDLWEHGGILRHCILIDAARVTDDYMLKAFYFPK